MATNTKSKNPLVVQSVMSQLVFSTHQNPEEVGSSASEVRDFPERARTSKEPASFFHALIQAATRRQSPG